MTFKHFLYLTELSYKGNVGFQEIVAFYRKATDDEIEEMEIIVQNNNWNGFRKLIKRVTGVNLL